MYEILLTALVAILLFLLPGLSLVRAFHLATKNTIETIFYSISLSFAVIVAVGFLLGNTVGITLETVLDSFLLASLPGLVFLNNKLRAFLTTGEKPWKRAVEYGRTRWKFLLAVLAAVVITAFNWSNAIGTHAIDMGEHVYWAKVIMITSRMPNYYTVEPLDQAVKFTYGAHLMLAQFFVLAGIPIEEYSWIPTVIGSVAIWTGVVLFAFEVTGSKWAAVVAATLYGGAYQPYGYIQRGNLPDICGYLFLISTVYSILRVRKSSSFAYALGLTAVSVIPYHQLAAVILPVLILLTAAFSYARSRSELVETLRTTFAGSLHQAFWVGMVLLAFVYAATVTYVSNDAASQLVTAGWRFYVPAFYKDFLYPGIPLGLLGLAGLAVILPTRKLSFIILMAWTATLVLLANALLVGIPIPDPGRFLWRLSEPFAILGAIFVWFVVNKLKDLRGPPLPGGLAWIRHNRIRLASMCLIVAVIGVHIAGLLAPALEGTSDVWSSPPRFRPTEAFYEDDKRIGQWLALNASSKAVITNDYDVDPTATWVQVYSMKPHFIYRADFAAIVAPTNYIQIYKSMAILYESPSDARVPVIIQRYNLTYVVAHTDEIRLFSSSPWFSRTPVFQTGGSALFVPNPIGG